MQLPASPTRPRLSERYALIGVCVTVAIVYATLLDAPSLIWDDDLNVFENPYYRDGTWWKLWLRPHFGMYIPVTSTIWAGVFALSDGAVWPFRALNIGLHLANVTLFAAILSALLRKWEMFSGAAVAIAIAIFALHPQQTAVVSWISGARDLSATMFALAALAVFLSPRIRHRAAWSTALFTLALLSKPSVVAIPVVLVAIVWWFDRPRIGSALRVAGVWALLAIADTLVTRTAQSGMFAVAAPVQHRPFIALDALGFYLLKTIWPFPLAADYGRSPDLVLSNPTMMIPTISAALVVGAVVLIAARRQPQYRIALLWPILLAPVLGLIPFPYQRISTVADHYNYLPLAVVAATMALLVARSTRMRGNAGWLVFGILLGVGATASWARTVDWSDNDHFFDDMLRKNPRSFSAVINIAAVQCDRGNWQVGLTTIRKTAVLARTDAAFLANETYCLFRAGDRREVLARQERLREPAVIASLDSNPAAAAVLASSFAGAFIAEDRPLRAFAYLCQAAAVAPEDDAIARNVATAKEDLRRRGREVTCRGKIRWDLLEQIVRVLD